MDAILDGLNFRALNFENTAELNLAAKSYAETPRYWDPEWETSAVGIASILERFEKDRDNPGVLSLVVENSSKDFIGFHRVIIKEVDVNAARYSGFRRNDAETTIAQILSLWVHDDYWGKGIARELKRRGEEWARGRGATRIETAVHYKNQRMFELNQRLGFEAGNIAMSKDLL